MKYLNFLIMTELSSVISDREKPINFVEIAIRVWAFRVKLGGRLLIKYCRLVICMLLIKTLLIL